MTIAEWTAYAIGFIQGFAFFIFFAIVVYVGGRIHGWRGQPKERKKKKEKKILKDPQEL